MRLETKQGKVVGWYCLAEDIYNDLLTTNCKSCNELRPAKLAELAIRTRLEREGNKMSEVELHAEFFAMWQNEERLDVSQMNDAQLTEHRNELARIILEGKVRIQVTEDEQRQRRAKSKVDSKPWLVPTDVNEAVKAVATRKERMSKLDKIQSTLANIMSDEDAAELMRNKVSRVTDTKLKKFNAPKVKTPTEVKQDEKVSLLDLSFLKD